MYPNLIKLNLEDYIKHACGGSLQEDKFFRSLDTFVGSLSEDNIEILSKKFNKNAPHSEISDLLHEVEVACAFHPKANFLENGPDLENGVFIEVKALNESKGEQARHESNSSSFISRVLSTEEKMEECKLVCEAIYNKATYHLEKANSQLRGKGLIYLIWDYNVLLHGEDGQVHSPISNSKCIIQTQVEKTISEFQDSHPCLTIKSFYFGDLREFVSNSHA